MSYLGRLDSVWGGIWGTYDVIHELFAQTAGMPVMKIQNEPPSELTFSKARNHTQRFKGAQTKPHLYILKAWWSQISQHLCDELLCAQIWSRSSCSCFINCSLMGSAMASYPVCREEHGCHGRPGAKGQGGQGWVVTCLVPLAVLFDVSKCDGEETDPFKQRCCQPPLAKCETSKSCGTKCPVMSQRLYHANMQTSSFCSQHCAGLNSMPNRSACNGATTMKNNET